VVDTLAIHCSERLVENLLLRGAFISVAELQAAVLDCIGYDNCTMAKPFKGIYKGKPLVA
jgi:hypothetical protein